MARKKTFALIAVAAVASLLWASAAFASVEGKFHPTKGDYVGTWQIYAYFTAGDDEFEYEDDVVTLYKSGYALYSFESVETYNATWAYCGEFFSLMVLTEEDFYEDLVLSGLMTHAGYMSGSLESDEGGIAGAWEANKLLTSSQKGLKPESLVTILTDIAEDWDSGPYKSHYEPKSKDFIGTWDVDQYTDGTGLYGDEDDVEWTLDKGGTGYDTFWPEDAVWAFNENQMILIGLESGIVHNGYFLEPGFMWGSYADQDRDYIGFWVAYYEGV